MKIGVCKGTSVYCNCNVFLRSLVLMFYFVSMCNLNDITLEYFFLVRIHMWS